MKIGINRIMFILNSVSRTSMLNKYISTAAYTKDTLLVVQAPEIAVKSNVVASKIRFMSEDAR